MLDTIKISLDTELSVGELKGWRERHGKRKNGFTAFSHTYSVAAPNGCKVTCVYYANGYQRRPILTLEFSLPKLLYGNNVKSVDNLDTALSQANTLIGDLPGIPDVNLR